MSKEEFFVQAAEALKNTSIEVKVPDLSKSILPPPPTPDGVTGFLIKLEEELRELDKPKRDDVMYKIYTMMYNVKKGLPF